MPSESSSDPENTWLNAADVLKLLKKTHYLDLKAKSGETVYGNTTGVAGGCHHMDGICLSHIAEGDELGCENGKVRLLHTVPGFFDPYPLRGDGPIEPPPGAKVWVNGGFSRRREIIENAIRWREAGHYVVLYLPIESSTQDAKRLLQYGVRRLYFESRPYTGCRAIEILILTGAE